MDLMSYDKMMEYLKSEKRTTSLLLGNGFSMAYDESIFSYNALSRYIENINNELLLTLFKIINTKNFELIMQQLDTFYELANAFGSDIELLKKIKEASESLKSGLIDAVKELHPKHVFTIPVSKCYACSNFIKDFLSSNGNIFTTNYDILLYWVLMRYKEENAIDGFGRYVDDEDKTVSDLIWGKYREDQRIHYLHGALHLFDMGFEIIKEEYDMQNYIIEKIKKRMDNKEYPIFVTAGNAKEKLTHIYHNHYLSYCYDVLSSIQGSLVTFGFNFGDNDSHIINAINAACKNGKKTAEKLHSIYIGIYSDSDLDHINQIEFKFKCKVNKYDARTAQVWGDS